MNDFKSDQKRQVIPRWRDFIVTAAMGELDSLQSPNNRFNNANLEPLIQDWIRKRTYGVAVDLVSSAYIVGEKEKVKDAAKFILETNSNKDIIINKIANDILNERDVSDEIICAPQTIDFHKSIHDLRKELYNDQRNSIAHVDMARRYLILGQIVKAEKHVKIALASSNNNRFILRSAIRFYIHNKKDYNKAHQLVQNNIIRRDPWLLAADIALSEMMEKRSNNIRLAQEMIKSGNINPFNLAELLAELATVEMNHGSIRESRKLFRTALKNPNDNTIAQILWAKKKINLDDIEIDFKKIICPYEALTYYYKNDKQWDKAIDYTKLWQMDQLFSKYPAIEGSYLSSLILDDNKQAIEFAQNGIRANPNEPVLLNNLAVSYARMNNIVEAEKQFYKIKFSELDKNMEIVWYATMGLIEYRKHNILAGRDYYMKAIDTALSKRDKRRAAMASIYLVKEEVLAKSSTIQASLGLAIKYNEGLDDPEVKYLFEKELKKYISNDDVWKHTP